MNAKQILISIVCIWAVFFLGSLESSWYSKAGMATFIFIGLIAVFWNYESEK